MEPYTKPCKYYDRAVALPELYPIDMCTRMIFYFLRKKKHRTKLISKLYGKGSINTSTNNGRNFIAKRNPEDNDEMRNPGFQVTCFPPELFCEDQ